MANLLKKIFKDRMIGRRTVMTQLINGNMFALETLSNLR